MAEHHASSVPPRTGESVPRCCHWCGYQLTGLSEYGTCPECGTTYTPTSVRAFRPWPNAFQICLRVGWPILLWMLLSGLSYVVGYGTDGMAVTMFCGGWILAIVAIVNGYFQVRSLLRKSMPDRTRTKGTVAIFRALGTVACVVLGLALVLPPVACAACLLLIDF